MFAGGGAKIIVMLLLSVVGRIQWLSSNELNCSEGLIVGLNPDREQKTSDKSIIRSYSSGSSSVHPATSNTPYMVPCCQQETASKVPNGILISSAFLHGLPTCSTGRQDTE